MEASSRKVAAITGVSRTDGVAAAVARALAPSFDLFLTGHPGYDADRSGTDARTEVDSLVDRIGAEGARVGYLALDLAEDSAPERVVAEAIEDHGRLDVVVAAHAHSTETRLGSLSAEEVDRHLIVNVRATLLLVSAFARAFDQGAGEGRVILFSSGQRLGPMPDEMAYAASKGAIEALVTSLAAALAAGGITVNAVNPGPTDTGWAVAEACEQIRRRFPAGRWGRPEDAARLVAWLAGPDSGWVTGQVIDSEGGFRR